MQDFKKMKEQWQSANGDGQVQNNKPASNAGQKTEQQSKPNQAEKTRKKSSKSGGFAAFDKVEQQKRVETVIQTQELKAAIVDAKEIFKEAYFSMEDMEKEITGKEDYISKITSSTESVSVDPLINLNFKANQTLVETAESVYESDILQRFIEANNLPVRLSEIDKAFVEGGDRAYKEMAKNIKSYLTLAANKATPAGGMWISHRHVIEDRLLTISMVIIAFVWGYWDLNFNENGIVMIVAVAPFFMFVWKLAKLILAYFKSNKDS